MPPGTLSADSWWVWDGAAWVPALSADGMWRWDGTAWIPVPAAWEAPQPARGRARPAFVAATILVVVALIAAV
ncbi:MAG TPA: hypothetical protein VFO60_04110, partial [Candidatus Dormibacteraeota bacterium]|nr:hypothetical protein [Candidatus Dormibacteraeota bacterium]